MHAVVTGATSGIGEATAQRLARDGLAVTLVGRSDQRLHSARERIVAAVPGADVVLERADLAEPSQVRELAGRLLTGPTPDVIISNAAVVAPLDRVNSEGLPRMLAVNYLAPYLLLRILVPALDRTRAVVVATDPLLLTHAPADLGDVCFAEPRRWGEPAELWPYHAYMSTKSMSTMFVTALARRLAGIDVTVNACHPGMIAGTGLGREAPGLDAIIMRAYQDGTLHRPGPQPGGVVWESGSPAPADLPGPDTGADTPAWLATSPAVEGMTGGFYVDRARVPVAPHLTDPERCERLWHDSAMLVGLAT